ncbi:acylglycerol kinase, mitochondrial [Onthophagus taurus]|uniref:acylglycerol kinase, mitochondrial n=1 Tax=Onthophagus taurus TaxID=166361 RepID=UPI0039BDCA17
MAFVIKFAKGVRNHWKKSIIAALATTYGINYAIEKNQINSLMRVYCEKATEYGKQPISSNDLPRTITIILNPNANKRKALKNFEKYCAPILNLAGICVDVIQTNAEGHARSLMETLPHSDAVVVAGGDGTLSEVVTGMLRKSNEDKSSFYPLGVLPLGRTNCVAKNLFPGGKNLEDVRSLADASLAVVEEMTKPVDIMRIEVVDNENQGKPVYAVSGIEWGAYRDAEVRKDSYWYLGVLRKYATYIFNGYKNNLTWDCSALVRYSEPCQGCSNCYIENNPPIAKRWYHRFLSNKSTKPKAALLVNEKCSEQTETKINTTDLSILTSNAISASNQDDESNDIPSLIVRYGPSTVNYFDFVTQGWKNEHGQDRTVTNKILARQIEIEPELVENKELFFSIDKEAFEVKPVRVTLLPKYIQMFCKKSVINV